MSFSNRSLDNPINWSFRVGRLFDIDIRVHITFVIFAIVMIAMEIPKPENGIKLPLSTVLIYALGTYAILFLIVLLHEFGHCFGARYVGGEADEILLWPLGGLAYANPPHTPRAHMVTTVAGPMVNVIICALCSFILVFWTGRLGAVPWNPIHPMQPVDTTFYPGEAQIWLLRVYGISYLLLLFNLLPIFPFDGGRILQAYLWPKKGYRESMMMATVTGMIGAILVGLFGLFLQESWLLLMIAVFGYLTCWQTRRMIRETGGLMENEFGYDFSRGYGAFETGEHVERKPGFFTRRRRNRAAEKAKREQQRKEKLQQEIERILRKVSQTGLASLTTRERRILEEETLRRRAMTGKSNEINH